MRRKFISALILLILIVLITGCGTLHVQTVASGYHDCYNICGTTPSVYGGTVQAYRMFLLPWQCEIGGEANLGKFITWPILIPFYAVDVPLSMAADTVILPFSIYYQYNYGNVCPKTFIKVNKQKIGAPVKDNAKTMPGDKQGTDSNTVIRRPIPGLAADEWYEECDRTGKSCRRVRFTE